MFYQIRVSKSGGCNPTKRGGNSYVSSNIKYINLTPLTINVNGVLTNQSSISICLGDSVKLSGNNSGNYVWDNGIVNNVTFKPTTTKTYHVTGTDENENVKNSSIEIIVNSKPQIQIASSKTTICSGDSVVLTASGAKDNVWNNAVVNDKEFSPQNSTRYFVKATDVNGCSNTSSVFITVNPLPTKPIITIDNSYLNSSVASQYQWSYNGSMIPNETNQTLKLNKNGSYNVEIKDGNGCKNTSEILEIKSLQVNELTSLLFNIFPNPTSDLITISNALGNNARVMDVAGKTIFTTAITSDNYQFSMKSFAGKGVYFVQILGENERLLDVKKVVVE